MKKKKIKQRARKDKRETEIAEATRPLYLITASVTFALNELLKTNSILGREILLQRLEEELKHYKINVNLLRKVIERGH